MDSVAERGEGLLVAVVGVATYNIAGGDRPTADGGAKDCTSSSRRQQMM